MKSYASIESLLDSSHFLKKSISLLICVVHVCLCVYVWALVSWHHMDRGKKWWSWFSSILWVPGTKLEFETGMKAMSDLVASTFTHRSIFLHPHLIFSPFKAGRHFLDWLQYNPKTTYLLLLSLYTNLNYNIGENLEGCKASLQY